MSYDYYITVISLLYNCSVYDSFITVRYTVIQQLYNTYMAVVEHLYGIIYNCYIYCHMAVISLLYNNSYIFRHMTVI